MRDQLAACEQPTQRGDSIWAVEQASDLGEQSYVFVNSWYAGGEPTGEAHVHQLVRVGNAVLATSWGAEWASATVEAGADDLAAETAPVLEQVRTVFGS